MVGNRQDPTGLLNPKCYPGMWLTIMFPDPGSPCSTGVWSLRAAEVCTFCFTKSSTLVPAGLKMSAGWLSLAWQRLLDLITMGYRIHRTDYINILEVRWFWKWVYHPRGKYWHPRCYMMNPRNGSYQDCYSWPFSKHNPFPNYATFS